jgi:hypothetical protein
MFEKFREWVRWGWILGIGDERANSQQEEGIAFQA